MTTEEEVKAILESMDPIAQKQMAHAALTFMATVGNTSDELTPKETAQAVMRLQGQFFEKMDEIMMAYLIQFDLGRGKPHDWPSPND